MRVLLPLAMLAVCLLAVVGLGAAQTGAAAPAAAPAPVSAPAAPAVAPAAPASPAAGAPAPGTPASTAYRLSPGDGVAVAVWGEDRFTQTCVVNGSGTISYPLLGDVPASGLTCAELQTRLGALLKKYLVEPQVLVSVASYGASGASVFVLGEVSKPGIYPVFGSGALLQALAAAGGPTLQASGQITITSARTGAQRTVALGTPADGSAASSDAQAQPEPGDVLYVERKPEAGMPRQYTVLGEVPMPGLYDIPLDTPVHVLDALQKAGLLSGSTTLPSDMASAGGLPFSGAGATGQLADRFPTADLEHATLTRGDTMVPLDLAALLRGDNTQNLLLQPGDMLKVPRRTLISVYAMGEVRSPGRQFLRPQANIMDLLTASGGSTANARVARAYLVRQVAGKPTPQKVDVGRVLQGDAKQNLALQDGDLLYISSKDDSSHQNLLTYLTMIPSFWYYIKR